MNKHLVLMASILLCFRFGFASSSYGVIRKKKLYFSNIKDKRFFFLYYCLQGPINNKVKRSPSETSPLAFLLMENYLANNVAIQRKEYLQRSALKVSLIDAYQKLLQEDSTIILSDGHVEVPLTNFYEGTIDVNIAAERNRHASNLTRGFAGIAFRKQSSNQYELVYLRVTNGQLNRIKPPGERIDRAVQYVSLPQWDFDTLRTQFPGKYEAGAKIAEKRWNHLRLLVKNSTITASIDGQVVLNKIPLLGINLTGSIAYWVGDGTDAYFSNLRIHEF